ncbi:hypothetical protein B0H17DRAFT_1213757 [Mycena rosella]|uniref:Uncharacterized protein n=1 Tax=Mycena rosella TaxID=1033263 RepID=A0AAD7CQ84_MYCRO|nr:hypothetical protein B0H17DRAFT_1213757 [Mycena rosella]
MIIFAIDAGAHVYSAWAAVPLVLLQGSMLLRAHGKDKRALRETGAGGDEEDTRGEAHEGEETRTCGHLREPAEHEQNPEKPELLRLCGRASGRGRGRGARRGKAATSGACVGTGRTNISGREQRRREPTQPGYQARTEVSMPSAEKPTLVRIIPRPLSSPALFLPTITAPLCP